MLFGGIGRAMYWPILIGFFSSLFHNAVSTAGRGHGHKRLIKGDRGDDTSIRALKEKEEKQKQEGRVDIVSCKKNPYQLHCQPPTPRPTPSPTTSPSSSPSEQCGNSYFTTPTNSNEVTKFSFTNEIDLEISCGGGIGNLTAIESAFVSYQNDLLTLYGCTEDIEYDAAAITGVCFLGVDGGCVDFDEVCGPDRRNLQESSVGSANVRYKYNTLGNCRRNCAESSLPKEDDCVDCGGRKLRARRAQDDGGGRDLLVATLNGDGIDADGAVVQSDGKNDCSEGSADCCSADGKCCGVTQGCSCPEISESYCAVTDCDLPGCCGLRGGDPLFSMCPWDQLVCFCSKSLECYGKKECSSVGLCSDSQGFC